MSIKDNPFEGGNSLMKVKDLTCTLHMPEALKSRYNDNGEEIEQALPPCNPIDAFVVDEYPACPSSWEHGSSKASSYFVPVKPNKGMWLDFNRCSYHDHDVAIIISIQGVNPITGLKQDKMKLEKYRDVCPVSGKPLRQDRYSESLGYKLPPQNYLATTGTPSGLFWLDGFRASDGRVQQYLFTEEELKGIAHQILGSEKVDSAIGIAYFLSKSPKPKPINSSLSPFGGQKKYFAPMSTRQHWKGKEYDEPKFNGILWSRCLGYVDPDPQIKVTCSTRPMPEGDRSYSVNLTVPDSLGDMSGEMSFVEPQSIEQTKKYEIGAGAAIRQVVYEDPKPLDYWNEEPEAFIYINYCSIADAMKIIEAGKRKDEARGFMTNLKIGN